MRSGRIEAMTAWVLTAAGAAFAVGLELLEALAIVLAVGVSRHWRDALIGAAAAVVVLAVAGLVIGPVILAALPLDLLRCVVGVALLLFGLEWLGKGGLGAEGRAAPRGGAPAVEFAQGVPRGARGDGGAPTRRARPSRLARTGR